LAISKLYPKWNGTHLKIISGKVYKDVQVLSYIIGLLY
jgi:hypothetical protein